MFYTPDAGVKVAFQVSRQSKRRGDNGAFVCILCVAVLAPVDLQPLDIGGL